MTDPAATLHESSVCTLYFQEKYLGAAQAERMGRTVTSSLLPPWRRMAAGGTDEGHDPYTLWLVFCEPEVYERRSTRGGGLRMHALKRDSHVNWVIV